MFFLSTREIEAHQIHPHHLKNMAQKRMTDAQKVNRAISHFDQWEKLFMCFEKFADTDYDLYMKLREDSVFLADMNMRKV